MNEVTRKYLNFYEMCSKIGGIFGFFIGIFNFIAQYFSRKSLVVDFVNKLIFSNYNNRNNIHSSYFFNKNNKKNSKKMKTECRSNKNISKMTNTNSQNERLYNSHFPIKKINYVFKYKFKLDGQKYQISLLNYLLPFFYLKKKKKYRMLYMYSNIIDTFLSLEEILPIIERMSKYFKEKKNKTNFDNNFILNMEPINKSNLPIFYI